MSDITVASTTDTQESVNVAAGLAAEPEAELKEESRKESESAKADKSAADSEPASLEKVKEETKEEKDGTRPDKKLLKRIDKLTAEKYDLRSQNEDLRKRLDDIESRLAPAAKPEPQRSSASAEPSDKPTPDKFESYEQYVEALAKWTATQEYKALSAKEKEAQAQQSENERLQQTFDTYNDRVAEARGKYDDFDDVVGREDLQIPQAVQLAVIEMSNGPDVAYHLGKNPSLCKTLLEMSPLAAVAEIGRISATLSPGSSTSNGSPQRRTSGGPPPPIRPVSGSSTRSAVALDEMDYQDYRRVRDQQRPRRS